LREHARQNEPGFQDSRINNVKGKFREFEGSIVMDNATITEASGTIQVKSVDTGVPQRDDHLRTADFFDATNYPTITFMTKPSKSSSDNK
jgi:polyisoprenoid-binding protein YceI